MILELVSGIHFLPLLNLLLFFLRIADRTRVVIFFHLLCGPGALPTDPWRLLHVARSHITSQFFIETILEEILMRIVVGPGTGLLPR